MSDPFHNMPPTEPIRHAKRRERGPWTWPVVALVALLVVVTAGTVVAVGF